MAPHHVEGVNNWISQMKSLGADSDSPSFGASILHRGVCVEADDDNAVFEYTVEASDCNQASNLHGGNIATLIDNLTSAAMFTRERKHFKFAGVSSDLHVTYLNGAPMGTVLRIECHVNKVGAGLAMLTAEIKDKATGRLLATGSHTKFNTDRLYSNL